MMPMSHDYHRVRPGRTVAVIAAALAACALWLAPAPAAARAPGAVDASVLDSYIAGVARAWEPLVTAEGRVLDPLDAGDSGDNYGVIMLADVMLKAGARDSDPGLSQAGERIVRKAATLPVANDPFNQLAIGSLLADGAQGRFAPGVWAKLATAGLERSQTVLIAGAAGGVGHLAVQFAKRAGARVIGTASARNRDHVLGLGADQFIDYTSEDVAAAATGVDVAFDTVGGDAGSALLATVRDGGVFVSIVGAGSDEEAAARGVRLERFSAKPDAAQLKEIGLLVAGGDVSVKIAEVLPFSQIARAHELSEGGHTRGKIIVSIPD